MSHSQGFERGRRTFSHKNIILLPKRCQMESAVSVLNTCICFIVVLFYSTGQSSSLDAVCYSIGLRSLYVDQGLKKTTHAQVFSIRTTVEKIKINDISA